MMSNSTRMWYCPNPNCDRYEKDATRWDSKDVFGKCGECKTTLKSIDIERIIKK